MIRKIYHISDIHIPNIENNNSFSIMTENFLKKINEEVSKQNKNETRIVLAGDIFDLKNKTSPEANSIFFTMLNGLNSIAKTIIITGNHDMLENNKSRKDALSPVFDIDNAYENVYYADKILNYKSGYIVDENIIWVLYSIWDKYSPCNIEEIKKKYPDKKIIGLIHAEITGSKNFNGKIFDSGVVTKIFSGCDCVMAGHIHKRQEINKNGVKILYPGSLFQLNEGETITGHGFVEWDMDTMNYRCIDIENPFSIFKFKIDNYEDIYEDTERLINL